MKLLINKMSKGLTTVALLSFALVACGGGAVSGFSKAGGSSAGLGPFIVVSPDPVTSPIPDSTPTPAPATATSGTPLTDLKIDNTTGSEQSNIPFTFGHVFAVNNVPNVNSVTGQLSDGTPITLQVNKKAKHTTDNSLRHAVISGVLPILAPNATETIRLYQSTVLSDTPITAATFLSTNPGFSSRVYVRVGAEVYSASARTLLAGSNIQWLNGPSVNEWIVSGPLLKTSDNVTPHPDLTVRFAIRSFTGSNKTKVDITIENTKTFTASTKDITYDSLLFVGGVEVDNIAGLTHYHHARWHKSFWWGATPQIHIKHNTAYLIATKAVSNYDQTVIPSPVAIAQMGTDITGKVGPMKVGLAVQYMPQGGARDDIGPLPGWSVLYLLSMDKRAKDAMLATADGSGSWAVHYRDETATATSFTPGDTTKTIDLPVRIDKLGFITISGVNYNYNEVSVHNNVVSSGPLPLPRCTSQYIQVGCTVPHTPDTAHQPSLVYLPYLVTGDYFYLEELQFWASWNVLETGSSYRQYDKALVKWQQVRGQAWSMRTLGQTAYITPDNHTLKAYFVDKVVTNLAHYDLVYTNASPNPLGVVFGDDIPANTVAPWQDDFFTWSIGYLTELGFSSAQPLFAWKAKFPVGRMTTPGYCWIAGSIYQLQVGNGTYTLDQAYAATAGIIVGSGTDTATLGSKVCASTDMTNWLTANSTDTGVFLGWGSGTFILGSMLGYSATATGTASDLQIALAVSASAGSGIANATTAWTQFMARTVKPDYSSDPMYAIVPR